MDELTTQRQRRLSKFRRDGGGFGPFRFSPKDLEILRLIHAYRYVTADHIFALVPGNRRHLAERLQGLFHHGYVQRLLPPAVMRVADGPQRGSDKFTYVLDGLGAETLTQAGAVPVDELAWEPRHTNRVSWFVEHQVGISTFHGALVLAARGRGDIALRDWTQLLTLRDWVKVRLQSDAKETTLRVAPDAYFAIIEGDKRRNFFLEFDRGTEEHGRIRETLWKYWLYLQSRRYQERYENARDVRVLVVTTSDGRVARMLEMLTTVDPKGRGLNQFWFTTEASYSLARPETVLGPIWTTLKTPAEKRSVLESA